MPTLFFVDVYIIFSRILWSIAEQQYGVDESISFI